MFRKIQNFLKLKDQKWSDDKPLRKKTSEHIWQYVKSGSWHFQRFCSKTKSKLRVSEDF